MSKSEVRVVRVTEDALVQKAFAIRVVVFVEEQKVPMEEEIDAFEKESRHFIAYLGSQPVGASRWRIADGKVKLERFAVLAEARGKGVGAALVQATIEDIAQQPEAKHLPQYLHAQIEAQPLYAKFGFRPYGSTFDECGILHQAMKK